MEILSWAILLLSGIFGNHDFDQVRRNRNYGNVRSILCRKLFSDVALLEKECSILILDFRRTNLDDFNRILVGDDFSYLSNHCTF